MRSTSKILLIFLFSLYSFFSSAQVTQSFSAAYMNLQCFPKMSDAQVDAKKAEMGLTLEGMVHSSSDQALAGVLDRIKQLGGDKHIKNVKVRIHHGGKSWGSKCASCASCKQPKTIELVQNCSGGTSGFAGTAGHFAHELGHIVGQAGFYNSYYSQVPSAKKCTVTHYCTNNGNKNPRNEEFAEVYAMFLHSPDVLKSRCPDSYNFMKQNVFQGGPPPEGTCSGNPTALAAVQNDPNTQGYTQPFEGMNSNNHPPIEDLLAIFQQMQDDHAGDPAPEQPQEPMVIPRAPTNNNSPHPGQR